MPWPWKDHGAWCCSSKLFQQLMLSPEVPWVPVIPAPTPKDVSIDAEVQFALRKGTVEAALTK